MKIQTEPCRGCGRTLYIHPVANLTVRLDVEPLDAQEAVAALVAGRNLWRVTATSVTGARPAELSALRRRGTTEGPCIVQEHVCTARLNGSEAPVRLQQPPRPPSVRQDPPAARTAPSQGLLGGTVSDAGPRRSSRPVCETCGQEIREGAEMVGIQLGDLYVYAQHVAKCYD